MSQVIKLRKSPQALALIISFVWASLVFMLVLLNLTLTRILVILGSGGTGNRFTLNTIVVIFFLSGTLAYILKWDKQKVSTQDGTLVVMNGSKRQVYTQKSISSIYLSQRWLGKVFNYGDIVINLNESEKSLSLKYIESPSKLLNDLKLS